MIPANTRKKLTDIRWKQYQNSPVPDWQHKLWVDGNEFVNGMAIILGRPWHNKDRIGQFLICLDADKRNAIEEICTRNGKKTSLHDMAEKFLVEQHKDNPDKAHIYFYSPIPFPKKSADSVLGLEVKGLGEHGIVFCSPSVHKDGHPYEIIGTAQPIVLNEILARELIQHLDQICINYGVPYLEKVGRINGELKQMVKNLTINHRMRIPEGQRHITLMSLADSLLFNHLDSRGETKGQLKRFFDQINDELCDPSPLSWSERDSIWKSALDFVDRMSATGEVNIQKGEKEGENGKIGNGNLVESIAEKIMRNHTFRTMSDTGEICHYDAHRGVYIPGAEVLIEIEAEQSENRISTYSVNEIKNKIRRRTYKSRTEFDKDSNVLNLKNGLLNINTGEFILHSSDYLSLVQLPISYEPRAECPNIARFLAQVLPDDVPTVIKLFGYCLHKTAIYEKGVLCYGDGDNGKSVLSKLLERFLGSQNVSHASLQQLDGNRFAPAQLYGKLANISADLKAEKLHDTGNFKKLVSGDSIMAEKKNREPFEFNNYAKLIFSANQLPESSDQGYAYFKRWIIFHFQRTFQGEEKDPNLIDKLATDEELSGLLNLALIASKQLIKDKGFSHIKDIESVREEYNQNANTIESFLGTKQRCWINKNDQNLYSVCNEVYDEYVRYCKEKNKAPVADNVFGSYLKLHKRIEKGHRRVNGLQEWCYVGIGLNYLQLEQ